MSSKLIKMIKLSGQFAQLLLNCVSLMRSFENFGNIKCNRYSSWLMLRVRLFVKYVNALTGLITCALDPRIWWLSFKIISWCIIAILSYRSTIIYSFKLPCRLMSDVIMLSCKIKCCHVIIIKIFSAQLFTSITHTSISTCEIIKREIDTEIRLYFANKIMKRLHTPFTNIQSNFVI